MLVCGEDLGFVPACLPPVMQVCVGRACPPLHGGWRAAAEARTERAAEQAHNATRTSGRTSITCLPPPPSQQHNNTTTHNATTHNTQHTTTINKQELGLIGLRIQRMPTQPGAEFNNPAAYPYLSVASPSCHDVAPLRAWCVFSSFFAGAHACPTLAAAAPAPLHCVFGFLNAPPPAACCPLPSGARPCEAKRARSPRTTTRNYTKLHTTTHNYAQLRTTTHNNNHRYEEDAERRERFFYSVLRGAGPAPAACDPEIARLVAAQHLNSPAILCILPLQVIAFCFALGARGGGPTLGERARPVSRRADGARSQTQTHKSKHSKVKTHTSARTNTSTHKNTNTNTHTPETHNRTSSRSRAATARGPPGRRSSTTRPPPSTTGATACRSTWRSWQRTASWCRCCRCVVAFRSCVCVLYGRPPQLAARVCSCMCRLVSKHCLESENTATQIEFKFKFKFKTKTGHAALQRPRQDLRPAAAARLDLI